PIRDSIKIDFTKSSHRSGGLVAPQSVANAISRSLGPVDREFRAENLFGPEATLFGFPLRALLADLRQPPQITSTLTTGAAPPISSGAFVLSNIAFVAGIRVPFQGAPSISLGFSSRAVPFQLSVLMFGGTGYAEITLSQRGIETFEAALEFGALVAIDFFVI